MSTVQRPIMLVAMPERFDVVVVGARCAGSPLAALLARSGLSVAVVDRAEFPSDTASTHIFQQDAVNAMARLGALERVLSSGAPWLEQVDVRIEALRATVGVPVRAADAGPWLCVRRFALDAVLVDAARAAGADVRTSTRVVGLVDDGRGRVAGVRVVAAGHERELRADLVVGADGMGSTVARLAGARRYHIVANQRFGVWRYFEGASWSSPATVVYHRWGRELVIAAPTDAGLYLVAVVPPLDRLGAWRADPAQAWSEAVAGCEPAAAALAGARPSGRARQLTTYPGFFRESAGPGWALVGDAGHFKDPTPGQGISDALRQVGRLAPAIVAGLAHPRSLDRRMARWARTRDADEAEMHWLAADLGSSAPMAPVAAELVARLASTPEGTAALVDVFSHRLAPSAAMSLRRLGGAAASLVRSHRLPARAAARDVAALARQDLGRRARRPFPHYEPPGPAPPAVAEVGPPPDLAALGS